MKKLFIFMFLCISSICFAGSTNHVNITFVVSGGEAVCESGSPTSIWDQTKTDTSHYSSESWVAIKLVFGSAQCVTGYYWALYDSGSTYSATVELYTDSSGDPGSAVSDSQATVINISDTEAVNTFTLASTLTLDAGTYWVVLKPSNSSMVLVYGTGTADVDQKYSGNGGSSWLDDSAYPQIAGINGYTQ